MGDEEIPDLMKVAIIETLEGWELVEFLQIPIEEIVEQFKETILDNYDDVLDLVNIRLDDDEDETFG